MTPIIIEIFTQLGFKYDQQIIDRYTKHHVFTHARDPRLSALIRDDMSPGPYRIRLSFDDTVYCNTLINVLSLQTIGDWLACSHVR